MTKLFLLLLENSLPAGVLILAVVLLRGLLRRAPRGILCLLWVLAALRLALPFPIRSPVSLVPPQAGRETVTVWTDAHLRGVNHSPSALDGPQIVLPGEDEAPAVPDAGTPAQSEPVQTEPVQIEPAQTKPAPAASAPRRTPAEVLSLVWSGGAALLLLYAGLSYARIRRQVAPSVRIQDNVYLCDAVRSPFILGLFRPRIYLPSTLEASESAGVLAHENAHLRRRDHLWKPLGFLLLAVYWFHPLVWAAYLLFCRDLELACDERVVRSLPAAEKRAYAETLLRCSMPRHLAAAYPLAFGETGVKARIRAILNYKKPAFWLILAAIAALIVLAVCFLTEPKAKAPDDAPDSAQTQDIDAETPTDAAQTQDVETSPDGTSPADVIEVAEIVGSASSDPRRRQTFELALLRLADAFDATGEAPDYAHLTAFLKERPDFAALDADSAILVDLLRHGFTVDSTRERILVHYAMALSAMENDPDAWLDLTAALDAFEPLNDAQYLGLLHAIAAHDEPALTELTGETHLPAREPDPQAPAQSLLCALFPGFPAAPGSVTYPAARADGEPVELTLETFLSETDEGTSMTFRLTGNRRMYRWSYNIRGDKVLTTQYQLSPGEALETIYRDTAPAVVCDTERLAALAEWDRGLPFDTSCLALFSRPRSEVMETLGMTEADWEWFRMMTGEPGYASCRREPVTIAGRPWTQLLNFAYDMGMDDYL